MIVFSLEGLTCECSVVEMNHGYAGITDVAIATQNELKLLAPNIA